MRICYECGKEIQDQKDMVLKEFRIAEWGVKWIKPFHAQCWNRRQKIKRKSYRKMCFAALSILTCVAISYLILLLV